MWKYFVLDYISQKLFFAKPKIMTQWVKKAKKVLVLVRKISKFETFEIFFYQKFVSFIENGFELDHHSAISIALNKNSTLD